MRKLSSVISFLLISLLLIVMTGCSTEDTTQSTSKNKGESAITSAEGNTATTDEVATTDTDTNSNTNETHSLLDNFTPEEQVIMGNLTGTWESQTANADGSITVVRAKIDNISGFTLTTGTIMPDGNGTYYSHVGSYKIAGNEITFSATTGGESNDGSSYQLRQDPGVYKYVFDENPELTQLVLTPTNEDAVYLTGEAPVVLLKT